MNRIIEVTDRLVAEVLPDGSIRWWEKTPVRDDGKWRGSKGVGKGRPPASPAPETIMCRAKGEVKAKRRYRAITETLADRANGG